MPVLGIGIDILHIPRIISLISRRPPTHLATRILSPAELSTWTALPAEDEERRARFLAVRWAVKEAAYKAFYPVLKPTWKDLTFLRAGNSQKPVLTYHPRAETAQRSPFRLHASVSHDGLYVVSTVLVESLQE
ncbi:4'-phosphopantetheinyl transferase [Artomyces pyxidatus]|uniref:4'-phosphopantetheinyl transferase n=1 Tax=Artomyces pyxidatus TaxID=48021 RepID=A0ACB8TKY1_9AGAM|nr:4'-phosphopantetheinyl transferase [Artomyces pyxidatus]